MRRHMTRTPRLDTYSRTGGSDGPLRASGTRWTLKTRRKHIEGTIKSKMSKK